MTTDDTTRPLPALHEPAAPEPGATAVVPDEPAPPAARGPRMRTQVFGLVLEFCGAGGQVTNRQWVPLGTKDFASVIAALPDDVDAIIRLLTPVHVDYGIVLLVLLLVAGALLLAGGVLGAAREARFPRN